jgi:hypothetical protein
MEVQTNDVLSTEDAARLLMVSPAWVRRLARDGWISKVEGRGFSLIELVQCHIRYMREPLPALFKPRA